MADFLLIAGFFRRMAAVPWTYWLLWFASLVVSVLLIALLRTRWGQSRPLQKCAVLSLLVHLVLAFLAMTVRIVVGEGGGGGGAPIRVRIVQDGGDATQVSLVAAGVADDAKSVVDPESARSEPEVAGNETGVIAEPERVKAKADEKPAEPEVEAAKPEEKPQPPEPVVAEAPPDDKKPLTDDSTKEKSSETKVAEAETSKPQETALPQSPPQPEPATPTPAVVATSEPPVAETSFSEWSPTTSGDVSAGAPAVKSSGGPLVPVTPIGPGDTVVSVSTPYSLRNAPGRPGLIAGLGGTAETEEAVTLALRWLAKTQSGDGRWDANVYGAGHEQIVLGQNRGGAGRNADTGISSLALLSFMGAGHTHLQGEYRDDVRRGLDFLLKSQATDGSLFGNSTQYAQMYCHSMATFALAEAQAMTGDRCLEAAVTKAVNFSLRAQDTSTGGWRYRPGDSPGDTSQLGWQMMALASAKRSGLEVPSQSWARVDKFLRAVRRGDSGGLASYLPVSPASTSMTAEALYCRQLLSEMSPTVLDSAASTEATRRILTELPQTKRVNLYYWYYATLALHNQQQRSDEAAAAWNAWNEALTDALLETQVTDGEEVGSWNTNTVWGGYGGRVYTTAMATMCLEVYYRYAPVPPPGNNWTASRPESERKN